MNSNPSTFSPLHFVRRLISAAVLCAMSAITASAEPATSLVAAFGSEGREFTQKAQPGHDIHGWLPKGWEDNSSWAKVSATYTKLNDSPEKDAAAVRIEFTKRDSHHVQFRPQKGPLPFKKGATYRVTGWARSAEPAKINVGFHDADATAGYFDQEDIATGSQWARFSFDWTPDQDCKGWLLIVVQDPGTVDVAGIALEAK